MLHNFAAPQEKTASGVETTLFEQKADITMIVMVGSKAWKMKNHRKILKTKKKEKSLNKTKTMRLVRIVYKTTHTTRRHGKERERRSDLTVN